ncbi:hypothetical protein COLO4_38165 [Corchorus olitorius]|uniref:Uncharacterized protein n=1 Tax=Corchorus olitorius TaxID=93759 RepID=A0A1R3FWM5_9ROSI|nr:hypothetical protein COLO4_38165 [Corchorus olitorius]
MGTKVQVVWSEDREWYAMDIISAMTDGETRKRYMPMSFDMTNIEKFSVDPANVRAIEYNALLEALKVVEGTNQALKCKIAQAASVDYILNWLAHEVKMVEMIMIACIIDGLPLAKGLDDGRDLKDANMYKQHVKALFRNLSRGQNESSWMSTETGSYVFPTRSLKRNIGPFSGFVWTDEEKQRAELEENLDKFVKEKLVDFPDLVHIIIKRQQYERRKPQLNCWNFWNLPMLNYEVFAPSPPAPASVSHHATVQKKKAKPLPSILTMPPRTGEFSILDEAGNFHGLKRGRSSPASIAKLMKKAPIVAENRAGDASQFSKAPVRRSLRNLTKTNVANSKELKGKKKLF